MLIKAKDLKTNMYYIKCLWCEEHVPITSKRGDIHLSKHMNAEHNATYGINQDNQESFRQFNTLYD